MAWAIAADGTTTSVTNVPGTTSIDSVLVIVGTGNLLIACGAWDSTTLVTCADTKGNSWTRLALTGPSQQVFIFYAVANGTGSTTITISGTSVAFATLFSTERSGNASAPFAASSSYTNGAFTVAKNPLVGHLVLARRDDTLLIVLGDIRASVGTLTVGTGYTMRKTSANATVMEDQVATLAGNYSPEFVNGGTQEAYVLAAAFMAPQTGVKTIILKR